MTPILFSLGILLVFSLLLAYETGTDASQPRLQRLGLLSWLVSGNWPAKVGALLLIVGIGALLRYAMLHLDLPPELKLSGGLLIAALLGAAAFILKNLPERRAIHLALAGAAFGVAYLTAYSAYGFFNYVSSINALALLALVAAAAGVFAMASNAMSVAILAMAGAYVAPGFALSEAGPIPVYGYYLIISVLSLLMVTMRGWRPLIHLSFLFTLAGGMFMGWTANFFQPDYYAVMQPLIVALAAVHVLMPLVERRHLQSSWLTRFDTAYFIALPLIAAGLTLFIAPTIKQHASLGLLALAVVWGSTATGLKLLRCKGAPNHALIAGLLLAGAIRCYIHLMPWSLVALALSVAVLALGPRMQWSRTVEELACGATLLFALIFVSSSITAVEAMQVRFVFNPTFGQRMLTCILLSLGARFARRRVLGFSGVLGIVAALFFVFAVGIELRRLNIDFVPQLIYSLLLCGIVICAVLVHKIALPRLIPTLLILALPLVGWWAADDASAAFVYTCFGLTPLCLLALSLPSNAKALEKDSLAVTALTILPLALLPFALATGDLLVIQTSTFELAVVTGGALLATLAGRFRLANNHRWNGTTQPVLFRLIALVLVFVTTWHIERGFWPALFEVLALLFLMLYSASHPQTEPAGAIKNGTMTVIAAALVVQAMTLRLLGPDIPVMDATDLLHMTLPAVVSLMWACIGAGFACWGAKLRSRSIWSAGALLLAIAAAKLILLDSNGLGQLENILAMIAAGLVFMAVAWLAPIPPAESGTARADIDHDPATSNTMPDASRTRPAAPSAEGAIWTWLIFFSLALAIAVPTVTWRKHTRKVTAAHIQAQQQSKIEQEESAQENGTFVPDLPDRTTPAIAAGTEPESAATSTVTDSCSQFTAQLPSQYVLYAAGEYSGRKLDFTIDQSGRPATRFDVLVNKPGETVVLALGAYEPSIWNIRWTIDTNIVGVYVSGHYRQAVAGLPPTVPLLNASQDNRSVCETFHLTRDTVSQTGTAIRKTLGRSAQTYTLAADGHIELGPLAPSDSAYLQSPTVPVQNIKDRLN
ncbi:MAG: DUF2339 domain-containing protein [Pseudomonadota bacterium]